MSQPLDVPSVDFDLRTLSVVCRGGAELQIMEFTLRQRDTVVGLITDLGDAESVEILRSFFGIEDVLGKGAEGAGDPEHVTSDDELEAALADSDDDDDEVKSKLSIEVSDTDVYTLIKLLSAKIGGGKLTELLAACVDIPENRGIWKQGDTKPTLDDATDWIADHVGLSQEVVIFEAIRDVNDLVEYLGNLWGLLPITATGAPETETEIPGE